MRAVRFHEMGGPEVLRIEDVEPASPGAGEVRIRVEAVGLNRAEVMFRRGFYLDQPILPSGIGYEASGTIEALGDDVEGFAVGDAVSVIPSFSMCDYTVASELAVLPVSALVRRPAGMDPVVGAAVWMPYVTVWGALIDIAGVTSDDAVLITAPSSSVGLAAIEVANTLGARPIAITRTADKRQALLDHGAAAVIVSDEEDITEAALRLTDGAGARVVFDAVGGPIVEALAGATAQFGLIILYGALSGAATPFPMMEASVRALTLRAYMLFEVTADPEKYAVVKRWVADGVATGTLKPRVDKVFSFEQFADAHEHLESNAQIGKVVVRMGPAKG
jgi:NADPH:quinone reductase-like Zn-dependent oxidoreductase